jgi:crossover junction endonuclease MUS81
MTIRSLLMDSGIPCETAQLAIGDFLWVARRRGGGGSRSAGEGAAGESNPGDMDCLVLDCIAERKTSADLAASIVDGRYQEQKIRLRNCGCRCLLYIVEGLSLSVGRGRGFGRVNAQTLEAALVSTQV